MVASFLLDRGAELECVVQDGKLTPLALACQYSSPDLVLFLLQRGANVLTKDENGSNLLHLASMNGAFGAEIIPHLICAGVNPNEENLEGGGCCFLYAVLFFLSHPVVWFAEENVLATAFSTSVANANALLPFVENAHPSHHYLSTSDPLGTMDLQVQLGGFSQKSDDFVVRVSKRGRSKECWSKLRNGCPLLYGMTSFDRFDVFEALCASGSVLLWILASREPGFQIHPHTGDTIFHLLCRSQALKTEEKIEILTELKRDFRNPLIPNFRNERAIDLCKEPELKEKLSCYMLFQPQRLVMNWFGPFFRMRVVALLLVLKRFRVAANKDVRLLLIRSLAKVEVIYVRSDKRLHQFGYNYATPLGAYPP